MKWIKISDITKLPDEPLLLYCAELDRIYYEDSGELYGAHPIYTHFMLLSSFIRPNFKHSEQGNEDDRDEELLMNPSCIFCAEDIIVDNKSALSFSCKPCFKKLNKAMNNLWNEEKKHCQSKCKLCDAREEWNKE